MRLDKKHSILAIVLSLAMLTLGWWIREYKQSTRYMFPALGSLNVQFSFSTTTQTISGSYVHSPLNASRAEAEADLKARRKNLVTLLSETEYITSSDQAVTTYRSENENYTLYDVRIPTEEGLPALSAELRVPKNIALPAPAILFAHGHFEDNSLFEKPETEGRAANFHAVRHAEAGFITLAVENRGTGNFKTEQGMDQVSYIDYELLQGRSFVALAVQDGMRALDYLLSRQDVDPTRVGVAGVSLGGELAMFIAAADERVKAASVSGFINIYQGLLRGHVHDLYWPQILRSVGEIPQIASIIAPRPLLVQHGRADQEFYREGVIRDNAEQAVAYINDVYSLLSAGTKFSHDVFEGGHVYDSTASITFFKNIL